jgi:hypothetical protein
VVPQSSFWRWKLRIKFSIIGGVFDSLSQMTLPSRPKGVVRRAVSGIAFVFLLFGPTVVLADPHPLPFSYPYATLPRGLSEVEQYIDLTPLRSLDADGTTPTTLGSVLITELEYGLTDKLEVGFYMQFFTDPAGDGAGAPLKFDGVKQRLRYRLADAGVWPVNVALYGEIAEFSDEIELEAKILLEKRIGRWQLLANLWGERAYTFVGPNEWGVNPTGGASYEIVPAFHLGIEYWMHGRLGVDQALKDFNTNFHHYVGPAFLLQSARIWFAVAPYVRLDAWNRAGQAGDEFGRFWIRAIVGIPL